jgi:DNA-binding NtrC family response regulator
MTTARRPRSEGRLAKELRKCERIVIMDALKKHNGHNSRTAEWLGVSRRALYDKMRDYGLDGEASAMRTEAGIMGPRKVDLD